MSCPIFCFQAEKEGLREMLSPASRHCTEKCHACECKIVYIRIYLLITSSGRFSHWIIVILVEIILISIMIILCANTLNVFVD